MSDERETIGTWRPKCDVCGKFVSLADIAEGRAEYRVYVYHDIMNRCPDEAVSSLCRRHFTPEDMAA